MTNRLLCAAVATTTGFCLSIALARADIPPPQRFPAKLSKLGKSDAILVIRADDYQGRSAIKHTSGAAYDTQGYCHVVLDIDAAPGAKGQFTVRGSATGDLDVGPQAPFTDEINPVAIDVPMKAKFSSRTVVAALRHNVTYFEWIPSADSTGTLYVWATAVSCSLDTNGF